ncbi:hypothetical protein AB0H77_32370 [Streptomyces sp. NPDC050844]
MASGIRASLLSNSRPVAMDDAYHPQKKLLDAHGRQDPEQL